MCLQIISKGSCKGQFTRLHFTSMQTDEPLAGSNILSFTIAGSTSAHIHGVSKTAA